MPCYSNQTSTTFIVETYRLNRFNQSLVINFFNVNNCLAVPIVPINLATCAVVYLWCDCMWDNQLNHIELRIWGSVLLSPSHASVRLPFLHQASSKNEVPPVPIHTNKSTQHRLCTVYRPSQQSTHISQIMELYGRQVCHCKLTCCRLDNSNET